MRNALCAWRILVPCTRQKLRPQKNSFTINKLCKFRDVNQIAWSDPNQQPHSLLPMSRGPQQASLPKQGPFSFYKFHKEVYIPILLAYGTMVYTG